MRECYHDGSSIVTASGMVDDDVSIEAPGISAKEAFEEGALRPFNYVGESVPAGTCALPSALAASAAWAASPAGSWKSPTLTTPTPFSALQG